MINTNRKEGISFMSYEHLLSPLKIGSLTIRNRVIMGAMGNGTENMDQTMGECSIAYYAERAKGGVGLIINETTRVTDEPHGCMGPRQSSAASDRLIPSLKELADAVHFYGGAIFMQLHHPGRQGFVPGGECFTPSGVPGMFGGACHTMTVEEIHKLVGQFVDAAERCYKAGIDGVEIHGAHGYLLTQFLSPFTNKRTDEYGGSIENRARIIKEIIEGIRNRVGRDYPVIYRLSADEFLERSTVPIPEGEVGLKLSEAVAACKYLAPFGLDGINVSAGIYETMNEAWEPISYPEGWKLYLAEAIKKEVDVPVFGVGSIRNPDFAEKVLAEGRVDAVVLARQMLADPDWVNKVKEGRIKEIRRCISCLNCMEHMSGDNGIIGHGLTCALNARNAREWFFNDLRRNGAGRKVAVIGAGPAGLEAARVLAERNFHVVLFEKSGSLGGQLNLAKKPPHKEKINWLIDYYTYQMELLGVEVRLHTPATKELILDLAPEAVFVATGSQEFVPPSIPGTHQDFVCTADQVLEGAVRPEKKEIAVVGSGMTGLETAELLSTFGNHISVVEMAETIAPGAYFQNVNDVRKRLDPYASYYAGHKLLEIGDHKLKLEKTDTKEIIWLSVDQVVLSLGVKADQKVYEEMKEVCKKVYPIGDTKKIGRIQSAVASAYGESYRFD